jgi:anhydro-N-acetylmuramic acid kinase
VRAIGLMSGTSLDGIDAALVDLRPRGGGFAVRLERFMTVPFEREVRERLLGALAPNEPSPQILTYLDADLGRRFARAALTVAPAATVDFVASHGLTAYHAGEVRRTLQIGDPYVIRDALGATVVFDFRRADCAAGGNGAPLVPYVDALLLSSSERHTVALNLGGIANVTVLRRGAGPQAATAWDTGPGNMLLDAFVRARTAGAEDFDRDGAYAARGVVDERVVRELGAREAFFLTLPPPKSTGRERFGAQLLADQADLFADLSLEDGCATLCAFTVATLADSLAAYGPGEARIVASGGGTRNPSLVRMLRERLARDGCALVVSGDLGLDSDAKEAVAFAILGYETLRGRPANVPSATGAERPVVLGAIVPFELGALLAKIRAEAMANDGV